MPSRERRRPEARAGRVAAGRSRWGARLVRALAATLRLREFPSPGVEAIWRAGTPAIYTMWHGQILLLPSSTAGATGSTR